MGGVYQVLSEEHAALSERDACNTGDVLPFDALESLQTFSLRRYENFINFCSLWFTFNLGCNFFCVLLYYAFVTKRYYTMLKTDRRLQRETVAHYNSVELERTVTLRGELPDYNVGP